jgi:endonuclease VIII
MPEGDTIFRAARALDRALAGKTVTRFETVLPKLSRVDEDSPLAGQTVDAVESRGKWLLTRFSGGLILLTHMLMNGSWHIYRPGEPWQRRREDMRIVIATRDFLAVCFGVQVAEFHTEESLRRHAVISRLGPDLLADSFDPQQAIANIQKHPEMQIADALLNQSALAGIGNIYKSELCFACGLNPFRPVSGISEEELASLVQTARKFLAANVANGTTASIVTYTGFRRTTRRANPADRFWVYGRAGQRCRKCGAAIQIRKQGPGARVTFWCPACQP